MTLPQSTFPQPALPVFGDAFDLFEEFLDVGARFELLGAAEQRQCLGVFPFPDQKLGVTQFGVGFVLLEVCGALEVELGFFDVAGTAVVLTEQDQGLAVQRIELDNFAQRLDFLAGCAFRDSKPRPQLQQILPG